MEWRVEQGIIPCDDDLDELRIIDDFMRANADLAKRHHFAVDVIALRDEDNPPCHAKHFLVIMHIGPTRNPFSTVPAV